MKLYFFKKIIILLLVIIGIASFRGIASAGTQDNISGYAYSFMPTASNGSNQNYNPNGGSVGQGTGWISLNCNNDTTCTSSNGNYGVTINSTTGDFSGYGWAGYFGWVDFSGAKVSPSCFTTAGTYTVTGTIQYVTNGGGWNGIVTMSDLSRWNNPVQITCNPQSGTGTFTGYAWGDGVVGWVSFAEAKLTLDTQLTCTTAAGIVITYGINDPYPADCNTTPPQNTCTDINGNTITYTGSLPAQCNYSTCTDNSGNIYKFFQPNVPSQCTISPKNTCNGVGQYTGQTFSYPTGGSQPCQCTTGICIGSPGGPIIPIYTEN